MSGVIDIGTIPIEFPLGVAEGIKSYVYMLLDPRTDPPAPFRERSAGQIQGPALLLEVRSDGFAFSQERQESCQVHFGNVLAHRIIAASVMHADKAVDAPVVCDLDALARRFFESG